jgi:hypothetical protein
VKSRNAVGSKSMRWSVGSTVFRLVAVAAVVVALVGCGGAGAGSGGSGGSGGGQTTITGNTLVSQDGGTTTDEASFQFSTEGTAPSLAIASTASTLPVSGTIRAGDIIFQLTGTIDTATGEFSVRASGTLLTIQIDISINGFYDPSTNEVTGGTTAMSVLDTSDPDAEPVTFESETVGNGESADKPLSDTSGTDNADPVPEGDRKFWEGTWVGNTGRIYFNEFGFETGTPTQYWLEANLRVVATRTQYNIRETVVYSSALQTLWGVFNDDYYDVAYISKILTEDADSIIAITYYPGDAPGSQYWKEEIFLNPSGRIWGTVWFDNNGTPAEDSDDTYGFGSISAAETNATTRQDAGYYSTSLDGLTKIID